MPGPFPYRSTATVASSQVQIDFGSPAPACEITVLSRGNFEILPALFDSGASRTAIPHRVAVTLNLRMIRDDVMVGGAVGSPEARPLFIADLIFAELNFTNHPVLSIIREADRDYVLIGRDILNRYKTTLDGPQRQFSLE